MISSSRNNKEAMKHNCDLQPPMFYRDLLISGYPGTQGNIWQTVVIKMSYSGMIYFSMVASSGRSIIVWRLGGFDHIVNAEYGFSKKISAVCGFSVATQLRKMEIKRTVWRFFAYFLAISEWFLPSPRHFSFSFILVSHCLLHCSYCINVIFYRGFTWL